MKKIISLSALFILVFIVVHCASKPVPTESKIQAPALTVLFSQQRKLNLEPCGCSLGQLGGLAREYNYLTKLRTTIPDPIYLVGSGGFVPENGYDKRDQKRYVEKAKLITEALARFRVGAFVPDQSDLAIGLKEVQNLSRKYGVPFVSSNLVGTQGKPLFLESLFIPHDKARLLVLGLSGKTQKTSRQIKLLDPKDVLKKWISKNENVLVTVVHSLDLEEVLELMKEFPEVTLWLGGNRNTVPEDIFQYSKTALSAEVQGWGRSLLRLDLEPTLPLIELYNSDQRRFQFGRLRVLNEKRQNIRAVASNEEEIKIIDRRLALLTGIAETPSEKATHYKTERIDLGSDFTAKNEMDTLLEKSRHILSKD